MPTVELPVAHAWTLHESGSVVDHGAEWPDAILSSSRQIVLDFDSTVIPAGATIESATLTAAFIIVGTVIQSPTIRAGWETAGPAPVYDSTPPTDALAGVKVKPELIPPAFVFGGGVTLADRSRVVFTRPVTLAETFDPAAIRLRLSATTIYNLDLVAIQLVIGYADTGQAEPPPPGSGGQGGAGAPIPQLPGGGVLASTALPRKTVLWKLVLCDRAGVRLSSLTGIASARRGTWRLNRPASFSFNVPSDAKEINQIHVDGFPMLSPLRRVVKGYRQEKLTDGSEAWVLRFAGHVWIVEDSGDTDNAVTAVVCFDPLQWLAHRYTGALVQYEEVDGASIVRQLVDTTNAEAPTPLTTEGGIFEATSPRTVEYQRKSVGEAIVELANAFNGFDIQVVPADRDDGVLAVLHAFGRLGQNQADLVFGWGHPPNNAQVVKRTLNAEMVANRIIGLGTNISSDQRHNESIAAFGMLEAIDSINDVTVQEYLDALIAEELRFRAVPRELVELTPQPGVAPEPWTHIHIGDLVRLYVGERIRGGFAGAVRCYGWDLDIDDDGVERISTFALRPE